MACLVYHHSRFGLLFISTSSGALDRPSHVATRTKADIGPNVCRVRCKAEPGHRDIVLLATKSDSGPCWTRTRWVPSSSLRWRSTFTIRFCIYVELTWSGSRHAQFTANGGVLCTLHRDKRRDPKWNVDPSIVPGLYSLASSQKSLGGFW